MKTLSRCAIWLLCALLWAAPAHAAAPELAPMPTLEPGVIWPEGPIIVADADTEVRQGPAANHASLGALRKGGALSYADSVSRDKHGVVWYCVYYGDTVGWVTEDCAHPEGVDLSGAGTEPIPAEDSIGLYTGGFTATASTYRTINDILVDAPRAVDGTLTTAWNSFDRMAGEWLRLSVRDGGRYQVAGLRIASGYWKNSAYDDNSSPKTVDVYCDGVFTATIRLARAWDYQTFWFDEPALCSSVTLSIRDGYMKKYKDCCISEIELLGPAGNLLRSDALPDWGPAVRKAAERIAQGDRLARGEYGLAAVGLQLLLREGFGVLDGAVDGVFGGGTQAAVNLLADRMRRAMPQCEAMTDGVVDAAYWRNMLEYMDNYDID